MRKNYKLDAHTRSYIKKELYNYEYNKRKLVELQEEILEGSPVQDGQPRGNTTSDTTFQKAEKLISSRSILIVTRKIQNIENAISKLNKEEQEIARVIFFKGHKQVYAQMHDNISKDTYYNVMNKTIYLTAIEFEMI